MPDKKLTDAEFEQMVNELPVYSSPDDFPIYRGYVAECIERGEEPELFTDWRTKQVTSVAA